jgi:hypothetical protein
VQRESKVMLVNREPGDHLEIQEPRDRKEEWYEDLHVVSSIHTYINV